MRICVLPGGKAPERKSPGAIGFDVCLRALVSPTRADAVNPVLRHCEFDFERWPERSDYGRHVRTGDEYPGSPLVYELQPGERVLGGIGVIFEMEFPMFFWVAPRSGLATIHGITVTNAPGTVDPDYRGEAGVCVLNNSTEPFTLFRGMRIAQVIFSSALIPDFSEVGLRELSETERGSGGFGSTGLG